MIVNLLSLGGPSIGKLRWSREETDIEETVWLIMVLSVLRPAMFETFRYRILAWIASQYTSLFIYCNHVHDSRRVRYTSVDNV